MELEIEEQRDMEVLVLSQEWSEEQMLTPTVDQAREFLEIANDFANPLDIVREAISNSYDAKATEINIFFDTIEKYGELVLKIVIQDDGEGMNRESLQAFFDLGNSTRRAQRLDDPTLIGEKGHGAKIFFNSDQISVVTTDGNTVFNATMDRPFARLYDGEIPKVSLQTRPYQEDDIRGTRIEILGYNRNRREMFSHAQIKDHVQWFTKHGSFERQFEDANGDDPVLRLKGLDRSDAEVVQFGHPFPAESTSVNVLFEEQLVDAPHYFSRRWHRQGSLPDYPDIKYELVFGVEGDRIKRQMNPMLRGRGRQPVPGCYTVQERYGLWLSKDYIPVQRKNEWVTSRGSEFTKFHAFLNCQALKLTANRGSIENTPSEIINSLEKVARSLFNEIVTTDEWSELEYLEEQANAYNTEEKELKAYERRVEAATKLKTTAYKGTKLVEPRYENGVYSLFVAIQTLEPDAFPFEIVDYDTHSGIDVIAKTRDNVDISQSMLRYVEFKHMLSSTFNHSFKHLHSIVCWKAKPLHGEVIEDISSSQRKMIVTPRTSDTEYTRYMLDDPQEQHKIEVFVLETYLKEKLGIEF